MVYMRMVHSPELLERAREALSKTQQTLGELLGVSRRTVQRWQAGNGHPTIQQWAFLARQTHAVDEHLAARIAAEMGETLVSLRIVEPPPLPEPSARPVGPPPRPAASLSDLVDSIVCAAAEAGATTPQSIRQPLLAAFTRAASVSLTVEEVRGTLARSLQIPTKG
jgi:DNA-binding XRE family transcriptional regulator